MRLLYAFLRARGALDWFQVVKVALWGPIIKIASFLSAFSIFKQSVARFVPIAGFTEETIELFERYIHPVAEFLFRVVAVIPSRELNDILALYLLLGGITTRFVKVVSDGLYTHLQEVEHRSQILEPPPGYVGNWEYQPGEPMSVFDRLYYMVMRFTWWLAAQVTRNQVELKRGERGNTVMNTCFSWFLYPIWPISLVYITRARRSHYFGLFVATPHPRWERELWGRRQGRDFDKKVAYVDQEMSTGSILLIQGGFILVCLLLIVTTNALLTKLL